MLRVKASRVAAHVEGGSVTEKKVTATAKTRTTVIRPSSTTAANRMVAMVMPETGLFDEPTRPAMYAETEQNRSGLLRPRTRAPWPPMLFFVWRGWSKKREEKRESEGGRETRLSFVF